MTFRCIVDEITARLVFHNDVVLSLTMTLAIGQNYDNVCCAAVSVS